MTINKDEAINKLRRIEDGIPCHEEEKRVAGRLSPHIAPDATVETGRNRSWVDGNMGSLSSPAIAPEASELPPLPDEVLLCDPDVYGYTEVEMSDYAHAAIAMHQAAVADNVLNACITYVVHGDADFDGMPAALVDYFKGRVDERLHRAAAAKPDVCAQMRALCSACGGTGDVTRIDGEYMGKCDCEASQAAAEPVPTITSLIETHGSILHAANEQSRLATKPAASEAVGQKPFGYVVRTGRGDEGWTLFVGRTEEQAARMRKTYPTVHMIYTAPAAPTDAKPDQNEFERQAAYQGARNFTLALGMKCENGWFPATYACPETELAWRVWANKSLKSSPQAPKTEGSKS